MAQPPLSLRSRRGTAFEAIVVTLCQMRGGFAVARQQCQKPVKLLGIEAEARRELPQKRPELFFEPQYARGKEIGERCLDVAQLLHMRDEAAALHGEDEIPRRLGMPPLEKFRTLQ